MKQLSSEEQIARMQSLMDFGLNESTKKGSQPILEFHKKAANGKTYGIMRECNKYYLMEAPEKHTDVLAEDFNYIGGFNNRKEHEYSSYAKASNALDLKLMSINEGVEKEKRVIIEAPTEKSEWTDKLTESMRNEIDSFIRISKNVSTILEDKDSFGEIPSEHTTPEAPANNPSVAKKNTPFTDTAVAEGEKEFDCQEKDHVKVGSPFNNDTKNVKVNTEKANTKNFKPVVKVNAEIARTAAMNEEVTEYEAAGLPEENDETVVDDFTDYPFPEVAKYDNGMEVENGEDNQYTEDNVEGEEDNNQRFESKERDDKGKPSTTNKNEFGNHPTFGKEFMKNNDSKKNKYDNEMVKTTPFDEVVESIAESIMERLFKKKS